MALATHDGAYRGLVVVPAGRRRLRVLQVSDSLSVGGAEKLLVTLASHIDRDRYDLRVSSLAPLEDTAIVTDLRALDIPIETLGGVLLRDPRGPARLAALARRLNVDVLHTHLSTSTMIGALAGALARRPVVATLHSLRDEYTRHAGLKHQLHARALRHGVRTVIACAPEVRAMAIDDFGLSPYRVIDVPNGIDTSASDAVSPAEAAARRAELLDGATGPLVLAVGNLLPPKGHTVLVEAAAVLRERFPGLRVAIVGREDESAPEVRARIAALGLERHVALVGQRRDVPALLAAADVFAQPSLWEGLPLALLEAMAAGVPAVASAVGGVPRVLEDGVTGRLAPPGDAAALAGALGDLLADPAAAHLLAAAGQAHVRATYGAPAWARTLERIYSDVAAGGPPRS